MRLIKKYKILTKVRYLITLPLRIRFFKRPKWKFLQKLLFRKHKKYASRRYKRKLQYPDNKIKFVLFGKWRKLKKSYKQRIFAKRFLLVGLNHNKRCFKNLKNNKNKTYLKSLRTFFRQQYFLDYMLFRVKYAASIFDAGGILRQKKIFVNDEIANKKLILKKGDFVFMDNNLYKYKITGNKYTYTDLVDTFYENDFYTQSFIVTKSIQDISNVDFGVSYGNFIKFNTLKRI